MDCQFQHLAIQTAKDAIEAAVMARPLETITEPSISANEFGGAFVTIHNNGRLRGCMGTFSPQEDLLHTLQEIAQNSARDPRFVNEPISVAELDEIDVDVSVLSKPIRTNDPLSLQVGVHGVLIRRGKQNGCFLPQVAKEQKWDASEFLSQCCQMKAGLPPESWKADDTEVFLFTAQVWKENETGEPQSASNSG